MAADEPDSNAIMRREPQTIALVFEPRGVEPGLPIAMRVKEYWRRD